MRAVLHLILHVVVPAAVARAAWPDRWPRAWLIMISTMLVDLDHLLARPVFDPSRCSIGFHPLHTAPALAVYTLLVLFKRTRILGAGLLIHMLLDTLDCF